MVSNNKFTRSVPKKQLGRIPELDDHITRNKTSDPAKRYTVVNNGVSANFKNITLARVYVEKTFNIVYNKDLASDVECKASAGWKAPKKIRKSKLAKAEKQAKVKSGGTAALVGGFNQLAKPGETPVRSPKDQTVVAAPKSLTNKKSNAGSVIIPAATAATPTLNGYNIRVTVYEIQNVSPSDLPNVYKMLNNK